jgi:hypothetical protein
MNRNPMLDRFFESARRQPSLMSRDDARDLIARPVDETDPDPVAGGSGRTVKVAAGGALIAGCILLVTLLVDPSQKSGELLAPQSPPTDAIASANEIVNSVPPATAEMSRTRETEPLSGSVSDAVAFTGSPTSDSEENWDVSQLPRGAVESGEIDDEPEAAPLSAPIDDSPILLTSPTPSFYRTVATRTVTEVAQEEGVRITQISRLNSPTSHEYNPVPSPDGSTLYFTSTSSLDGLGGHDIWVADRREGSNDFDAPVNIGSRLNSSQDEGGVTLVGDGTRMYFTSCERSDGLGNCDLYEARLSEDGWEEVRNVRELNSRYWESHPSVSADGNTIYFVSDRPGSLGGGYDADIYVAHLQPDGIWSRPENLGRPINSKESEDSPFITPAGDVLYFSSKGHAGQGDFDFFVAEMKGDGTWGSPQNLGSDINTKQSERFLSLSVGENLIYFSREDGGRDFNLYMAERKPQSNAAIITGTIRRTERNDYIRADLLLVDRSSGRILGQRSTVGEDNRFSLILGPDVIRRGGTIDLYGLADTLGQFRGELEIPRRDSYVEYQFDLRIIDSSYSSVSTATEPDSAGEIDRGITMALHQEMLLLRSRGLASGPLTIIDSYGREVLRQELTPEQTGPEASIAIDVSALPEGLYLLRSGGSSGLFRRPAVQ